jgi:hypothetical protein
MKLHELQIGNAGTRTERHGNAVTGCNHGVRGLAKYLASAASREQRVLRSHRCQPMSCDEVRPRTTTVLDAQSQGQRIADDANPGIVAHAGPEDTCDFPPGCITGMQHTTDTVGPLASQSGLPVRSAIERGAPLDELGDIARPFTHEHIDGATIAETVAGSQGVTCVEFGRIIGADGRRNPALRVTGVALAGIGFRQDDDVAGFSQ